MVQNKRRSESPRSPRAELLTSLEMSWPGMFPLPCLAASLHLIKVSGSYRCRGFSVWASHCWLDRERCRVSLYPGTLAHDMTAGLRRQL